MKAEDLAAYFSKKIGKSISHNLSFDDQSESGLHSLYAIEATSVRDDVLRVLVSKHVGEAEIPFKDGDTIEDIFDMALAGAQFRTWDEPHQKS